MFKILSRTSLYHQGFSAAIRDMARVAASATGATPRRSQRNVKNEFDEVTIKQEEPTSTPKKSLKRGASSATQKGSDKRVKSGDSLERGLSPSLKRIKLEEDGRSESPSPRRAKKDKTSVEKAAELQAKKLKHYTQFSKQSPFPDFAHPTPAECKLAHKILAQLHGEKKRPEKIVAPTNRAGCGDSTSVLDALVRTILSQNTSDKNSTRAKLNMDKVYGGSDKWDAIVSGGQSKLQETIKSGGLSVSKSKVIINILEQAKEKYGVYSLNHLFDASDEDAMTEMLSFQGVGPKTAACVLLFCLQRENFAVDTHVHRITGLMGWRPMKCSREETHAHLDVRIPDEDKYGLHILIIKHGKSCEECKAGGKSLGKCELRKAFRGGKVKGDAGEDVKMEEIQEIKEENSDVETEGEAIAHAIE
ncbi:base excision DNA repair protein [Xylariales sp. AK1849]|nr:base excision DNA repair protein [Xylariales sp. AK1849]